MSFVHRRFEDEYGTQEWLAWRKSGIPLRDYEHGLQARLGFLRPATPIADEVAEYQRRYGY